MPFLSAALLFLLAKYLHTAGINCILDATFNTENSRKELKQKLALTSKQYSIIECTCPEDVVISRIFKVKCKRSCKSNINEVMIIASTILQKQVLLGLEKKTAYPHKVLSSKIKVQETHISWIDFSSLQLRKKFCQTEVAINQVLCSDMYKGVVKIVKETGNTTITNLRHKGTALEYAVKMLELPQKFRMDNLITADKVSLKTIEKLTTILVNFHFSTPTNAKIKSY